MLGLTFTWVGALGTGVALGLFVLAGFVLASAGGRTQARLLSALLALDGVILLLGSGLMYLTTDPRAAYAWQMTLFVIMPGAFVFIYPMFWGTLATPLGRPFRTVTARVVGAAVSVAAAIYALARPEDFVAAIVPGAFSPWDAILSSAAEPVFLALILVSLGGLAIALHAWRRSEPGSLDRRRNALYAAAFGVRDACYVAVVVCIQLVGNGVVGPAALFWVATILPVGAILAFACLLTYAILTAHLFDLQLRVRKGLRRSLVGGTFVGVFVIVSQLVQNLSNSQWGTVGGAVGAGVMLLGLRPIERMADRVANAATPGADASGAYLQFRKLEVFKAAAVEMALDGTLSARDQGILAKLRAQLGIDEATAAAIQADALSHKGRPAA